VEKWGLRGAPEAITLSLSMPIPGNEVVSPPPTPTNLNSTDLRPSMIVQTYACVWACRNEFREPWTCMVWARRGWVWQPWTRCEPHHCMPTRLSNQFNMLLVHKLADIIMSTGHLKVSYGLQCPHQWYSTLLFPCIIGLSPSPEWAHFVGFTL
jgi:hypothetical protein